MTSRSKKLAQFAKVCPTHLADGLFVPRSEPEGKTDIRNIWDGGEIHFMGYKQLSVFDQSVLFSACARTGVEGLLVIGNSKSTEGKEVQLKLPLLTDEELKKEGVVKSQNHSLGKTSAYLMLIDTGVKPGGYQYQRLIESLKKLSNITVYRSKITDSGKKVGGSMNLLSFTHDENDQIVIFLNWRLAGAILGNNQNIQISLVERRKLKNSVAKILHAWCCGFIRLGECLMNGRGASYDSLCQHVWGISYYELSENAKKQKRRRVKEALEELSSLDGWQVEFYKHKVTICRGDALPIE